jgi:hypothetical protein
MYIKNSFHIIESHEHFANLVGEIMGDDAEEYVNELIRKSDYNEIKSDSDLGAYEAENESMYTALNDIMDSVKEIEKILNGRMNKQKVMQLLDDIKNEIDNQI